MSKVWKGKGCEMNITEERFREMMEDDTIKTKFPKGDNALIGLNIIAKYLPKSGVESAEHDIIYSASVEKLVNAGITEEDTRKLKELDWMIQYDALACFV